MSSNLIMHSKPLPLVLLLLAFTACAPRGTAQSNEQSAEPEKTAAMRLNGKIEEKDRLEHLYRPANGDPLSKSVKVLSGQSYETPLQGRNEAPLQGRAEDLNLDSVLKSNNFQLQAMNPHKDSAGASAASADLSTMRNTMSAGFAWGVGEWQVNSWHGGNGFGGGPYYTGNWSGSFGWDTAFDQRRVQANMLNTNTGYYLPPYVPARRGQLLPDASTSSPAWAIAPTQPVQNSEEKSVLWDAWYQKVSSALYQNWLGRGGQPGDATLHITVLRPRKIEAQLLHSTNQSIPFKQSLLTAVAALNGSPVLDFPRQSLKQAVSFDSVFSAGTDTIAGAYSDRRGEMEQVKVRH